MEVFLGKLTQQAMNYAIRSGITITAGYAIQQSSRLLKNVEGNDREELLTLQERLEGKIRIISPAIDMIELISARGNTSLESAVSLTKSLRWDIQALGQRLAAAANEEDLSSKGSSRARSKAQNEIELKRVLRDIRKLLNRIEDAVPLINLAITTSGASLSTSLPSTISPSRLLQASTFITAGDTQYGMRSSGPVQIGPTFTLSLYMLFSGHIRPQNEEDVRASIWKEVMHKARIKLLRVPLETVNDMPVTSSNVNFGSRMSESDGNGANNSDLSFAGDHRNDEYAYQVIIVEDLDDGRVHTFEDDEPQPERYDDIEQAGIREAMPIHQISKIFYADTGKILNIGTEGEVNSPILLLKRDLNAIPPRRMVEEYENDQDSLREERYPVPKTIPSGGGYNAFQAELEAQFVREHRGSSMPLSEDASPTLIQKHEPWRLPSNVDPEWLALEVYTESDDSDTESDSGTPQSNPQPAQAASVNTQLTPGIDSLQISTSKSPSSPHPQPAPLTPSNQPIPSKPIIRTSLSLLETILRLLSLQQFQQTSHLSIPDELLNFFLSESATTGAATGDEVTRRRLRNEARRRVGFDPYDESPIKLRGEDYQYRGGTSQAGGGAREVWNTADDGQYGNYQEPVWSNNRYSSEEYGSHRNSPRTDEGYDTRRLTHDFGARRHKTESPSPMLLKSRAYSSKSNTPDRSTPALPGSPSSNDAHNGTAFQPRTPPSSMGGPRWKERRLEETARDMGRKGSPLAAPGMELPEKAGPVSDGEVAEKQS